MLKKIMTSLLVLGFILGLASSSLAATGPKSATVSLSINDTEVTDESAVVEVNKGDAVALSATTIKQGSSYEDDWKVNGTNLAHATVLNAGTGNYESNAALDTSAAGEFEIEYSIVMLAGKSSVTFVGGKKTNVTVVEPTVSLKKITIKVKDVDPRYSSGSKPALTGYDATADATIELSDGTTSTIEDINFNYNKHENDATVSVEVTINGTTSTYELEIPFVAEGTEVVFNDPSLLE